MVQPIPYFHKLGDLIVVRTRNHLRDRQRCLGLLFPLSDIAKQEDVVYKLIIIFIKMSWNMTQAFVFCFVCTSDGSYDSELLSTKPSESKV